MDYLPFGQEIAPGFAGRPAACFSGVNYPSSGADTQSLKFTGKGRDAETGLDLLPSPLFQFKFNAGSPVQIFPLKFKYSADPQSWNLYSYVRNSFDCLGGAVF